MPEADARVKQGVQLIYKMWRGRVGGAHPRGSVEGSEGRKRDEDRPDLLCLDIRSYIHGIARSSRKGEIDCLRKVSLTGSDGEVGMCQGRGKWRPGAPTKVSAWRPAPVPFCSQPARVPYSEIMRWHMFIYSIVYSFLLHDLSGFIAAS